jgi:hypothetical protein
MNFTNEMNTLIQRYLKEAKSQELTLDEINLRTLDKRVWTWWTALACYKIKNYYERIEDVPEGLEEYNIMGKELTQYFSRNGHKWQQVTTKEDCKTIYKE